MDRGAHAGGIAAKAMGASRDAALHTAEQVLDEPADIRVVIAYEEAHKHRQRVLSAAQTRIAAIAHQIVGID